MMPAPLPFRVDRHSRVPLFRMRLPALDAFPRELWARLVAREARAVPETALGYPDPAGDPALRRVIAAYLAISRGIAAARSRSS